MFTFLIRCIPPRELMAFRLRLGEMVPRQAHGVLPPGCGKEDVRNAIAEVAICLLAEGRVPLQDFVAVLDILLRELVPPDRQRQLRSRTRGRVRTLRRELARMQERSGEALANLLADPAAGREIDLGDRLYEQLSLVAELAVCRGLLASRGRTLPRHRRSVRSPARHGSGPLAAGADHLPSPSF